MDTIRLDLPKLKTQQAVLEEFAALPGIPSYYGRNLDSLYEILTEWPKPLKLEVVVGGNVQNFVNLMGMLEDARQENKNLLFVVIMNHK